MRPSRRRIVWRVILVSVCAILLSSYFFQVPFRFHAIRHEPSAAISEAVRFIQVTLIERDFERSRADFPIGRAAQNQTEYEESWQKLHLNGFPESVEPVAYELMSGQRAIIVFLIGQSKSDKFYYRCIAEGDATTGYGVVAVFRANREWPPTQRIPITTRGDSPAEQQTNQQQR